MTVDFRHPLYHQATASNFFITADLFLCLIKLYEDFSKREPRFELSCYYDVYLEVTPNKKILKALFSVHRNYEKYLLNTISYCYDIENKVLIYDGASDLFEEKNNRVRCDFEDNLDGVVSPAIILKMIKQAWKYFVQHNGRGASLQFHVFGLTFFSDNDLFVVLAQPSVGPGPDDWMYGVVSGIQSYLVFDLMTLKIIKKYHLHTRNDYLKHNYQKKRRVNARINRKKTLAESKSLK